jgi:hypothetical protein
MKTTCLLGLMVVLLLGGVSNAYAGEDEMLGFCWEVEPRDRVDHIYVSGLFYSSESTLPQDIAHFGKYLSETFDVKSGQTPQCRTTLAAQNSEVQKLIQQRNEFRTKDYPFVDVVLHETDWSPNNQNPTAKIIKNPKTGAPRTTL